MKTTRQKNKGFTLIELAVVLTLVSLLMTSILAGMRVMQQKEKLTKTQEHLKLAEEKLQSYLTLNGAYPCPASYAAKRGDEGFGRSVKECITPAGETIEEHDIDDEFKSETITAEGRDKRLVRIGLLPFRSLGIPDPESVDGWGRLMQYAVTEQMTAKKTFRQKKGAIDVIAEDNKSRLTPEGSAQYVVFSTGEDGAAGYSQDGIRQSDCPADTLQTENCDGDAVFIETFKQMVPADKAPTRRERFSNISYDDHITYLQTQPTAGGGQSGVIVYLFSESCPEGFEKIEMPDTVETGDVERLSKEHASKGIQRSGKDVVCQSTAYSKTITVWTNKKVEASICPEQWTSIGYKDLPVDFGITYEVCAR